MKKVSFFAVILLFLLIHPSVNGQTGEETFKSVCSACHSIGKGRLVGPDLSGIYKTRNNEWLISFIRSSQKMVKAGDKDAVAIFNEYNKIPMPDNNLTDEQILSIIDYIKKTDGFTETTAEKPPAADTVKAPGVAADTMKPVAAADSLKTQEGDTLKAAGAEPVVPTDTLQYTSEASAIGRALYNGNSTFVNLANPCITCHNVNDQSMLGGGRLALDLTFSYSKLSPAGLNAILANPPFPIMKAALQNNPLTPEEITALISFLKSVDEFNRSYGTIQPGGFLFVTIGVVIALFLFFHLYVFYNNRKITNQLFSK